jgi:CubicO group peptidase (beta-lactamase class C family)
VEIYGDWRPQWAPVVEAFSRNFTESAEQGAGLALYHRGELVLNCWAGVYDNRAAGLVAQPWQEDTIVNIFSAGKGLVALCVLQLVAEGKIQLDSPIAQYWPEFSAVANGDIRVRDVMCHRSGLSAFQERIEDQTIFNWPAMIAAVTRAQPWWVPDSAQGYSPFIYGWILGELVRRVAGALSFGDYFSQQFGRPLQLSCYFGVPELSLATVADTAPLKRPLGAVSTGADSVALGRLMKSDPRGVTNRAFSNPITLMTASNSLDWRQAQLPAANAHANASALAKIYGLLACDGGLLPSAYLPLCWQEQTFEQDQVLGLPLRFSHGFMLSQADRADCRYGRGARAFGHPGAGGCVGFADPEAEIGFGYVTSRMGQSLLIDERAVNLIDAVYAQL